MKNQFGLMDKGHVVLALGFIINILLMLILTNYAMNRVEELNLHLQKVVREYHNKSSLIKTMHLAARERIFTTQHMLLIDDIFEQDEDVLKIDRYGAQFATAKRAYSSITLNEQEQPLFDELGQQTLYTSQILRSAVSNIISGDADTARRQLIEKVIPAQRQIVNTLLLLEVVQERGIENTVKQAEQQQQAAYRSFLIMGLSALALGVFILVFSFYLARRLTHQALHDPLTGICNRRGFEFYLNKLMQRPRERQQGYLCLMDLDHFKHVNDNGGHAAGDALLKDLVHKIGNTIRRNDIFARLGGDEFALVLEGCPLSNAQRIALEIRDTVRDNNFTWQGQEYRVGISIGMVKLDSDTYSTTELLSLADDACYSAKEGGRNQLHYYTESTDGIQFVTVYESEVSEHPGLSIAP